VLFPFTNLKNNSNPHAINSLQSFRENATNGFTPSACNLQAGEEPCPPKNSKTPTTKTPSPPPAPSPPKVAPPRPGIPSPNGFTGKNLVLSSGEEESYNAHVDSYYKEFQPATHRQSDLLQEFADLRWSLHQIFAEQSKIISFMADATTPAEMASLSRTLNNLNLYETRRRRAAKALEEEIATLQKSDFEKHSAQLAEASLLYKSYQAQGKTFDPVKYGFSFVPSTIFSATSKASKPPSASGGPPEPARIPNSSSVLPAPHPDSAFLNGIQSHPGKLSPPPGPPVPCKDARKL
jgi:hypothetical protein